LRVIFAGTPEFARLALKQLHSAGFTIPLVLTQPDRPAGRGMKLQASAVKQFALEQLLPVIQPVSLRLDGKFPDQAEQAKAAIEAAQADVMVVAAYGLILPAWLLQLPKLGCLNIHASVLPRWRGAAPIHRAIEAGDAHSGVTIMQMDEGLDTGDMLMVEKLPISADDTTASLHDKLAVVGGRMIVEALELAACGGLRPVKQPETGVCYARKIEKAEAAVDWSQSAIEIERRIRAFNPFPVMSTRFGDDTIKIYSSQIHSDKLISDKGFGAILSIDEEGIQVQCGQGVLALTELQRPGGKRLPVHAFNQGYVLPLGTVLQ
jgi:methionyl-tRNA formyltransferase